MVRPASLIAFAGPRFTWSQLLALCVFVALLEIIKDWYERNMQLWNYKI